MFPVCSCAPKNFLTRLPHIFLVRFDSQGRTVRPVKVYTDSLGLLQNGQSRFLRELATENPFFSAKYENKETDFSLRSK